MSRRRGEQGQVMVAATGLLLLFLAIGALALNVGWWLHDRRDAQNDVDAAALAGAQELPDEGAASTAANTWATSNEVAAGDLVCCEFEDHTGDGNADLIRARVEREPGTLGGELLDLSVVPEVKTRAAAARMRAVSGCVMPWAVLGDPYQGPPYVSNGHWGLTSCEENPACLPYAFHMSEFNTPGNFGALALYGNGATDYKEAIETPCGTGTVGACDQVEPDVCVGCTLQCQVKTGNMGQNTDDALTERDANSEPGPAGPFCDVTSYDDAKWMVDNSAICAAARAVLIPIIPINPGWPIGHSGPIEILGLATFYIAGWDRDPPYGDVDADGDTALDDMVWGYFMEGVQVIPAWKIEWGYSDDPFAPIKILLVE